jgi:hypothetical protein
MPGNTYLPAASTYDPLHRRRVFRGFDNLAIPDHDILLRNAAAADHHTIGNDKIGFLLFHWVNAFREFI